MGGLIVSLSCHVSVRVVQHETFIQVKRQLARDLFRMCYTQFVPMRYA
jgi:hypothetical protein